MNRPKSKLIIINDKGEKLSPELKEGRWGEGVHHLIDVADFTFDETDDVKFRNIERGNQLILKTTDDKKNKRTFYYWIESVTTHFDHGKEGHEPINEIILKASSYPSVLTRNFIEGSYRFSKGYGQIVKTITKKHNFKTNRVKIVEKKGTIHFKKMPILEAIRRMASIEGWCFYFRDKGIVFEPCSPPRDSGVTLTENDILSGTFTK